jgi:hypothetical protein
MTKSKLRNHICRVMNERQVPDGYIRNTVNMEAVPARLQKSWSNWVNKQIKSTDRDGWTDDPYCVGGHAEHYGGGVFYLHRDDLERLVKEFMSFQELSLGALASDANPTVSPRMSASQVEAAVIALCEINNGITLIQATLQRVVHQLERIADDADEMATKPGNAHDRVVATVESNGFHN